MASKQQQGRTSMGMEELDPMYQWQENPANFVLRFQLCGFKKQDFRVQVDGAGRLTVRGQSSSSADAAAGRRFNKVFQLPASSNLDGISGRFDAAVLTITVPKRPGAPTATGATIQDITNKVLPAKAKEDKTQAAAADDRSAAERQPQPPQETTNKPKDDVPIPPEAVEAKRSKPAAAAAEQPPKTAAPAAAAVKEEAKAMAPPAAPTNKTDGETVTKAVDRESLVDRLRRRAEEEEEAKRAAAAKAKADQEAHERHRCCGWKERLTAELQGFSGSEWAETVKNNKEVIAVAVAAFSLGLFVSGRLFSRN